MNVYKCSGRLLLSLMCIYTVYHTVYDADCDDRSIMFALIVEHYTHVSVFCTILPFPLQCRHSVALNTYYYQLNSPPTKVGWLGLGFSPATIPTAELTQYYNITQVMCTIVSSLELYYSTAAYLTGVMC